MKIFTCKFLQLLSLTILLSAVASAQQPENTTGYPVLTRSYVDVEGSPFLSNDYSKGTVKLADGSTYKDILIKYNQLDDVIYFQGKNNDVLSFVQPVNEFTIAYAKGGQTFNKHFRNGYLAISKNSDKSFYEILTDGTAQLLKRTSKTIFKNKPYNSATETQTINEEVNYYLFLSNKMIPIKKDKKSILPALSNKQTELDTYIKANSLNLKSDEDLIKLVVYYNSL